MSLGSDLRALARYQFGVEVEARRQRRVRQPRPGRCAYCGEQGDYLVVDHDHGTGLNRGLVHPACNAAIGPHTKSSVQRLVDYLSRDVDLGRYPRIRRD